MDVLELTQRLIEFESTSYNELPLARFIVEWLTERNLPCHLDIFNATDLLQDGKARPDTANVYVDLGQGEQTLMLYAHMDVVSASPSLFSPRIEGGRLIGRGATDMKSSLAALMLAAVEQRAVIEESGKRVLFAFVADEETSGTGARRHVEWLSTQGLRGDNLWCMLAEPTDQFRYVDVGGKGYIFLDLEGPLSALIPTLQTILKDRDPILARYPIEDEQFGQAFISVTAITCNPKMITGQAWKETGVAAHASRPQAGENALEKMLRRLSHPVANIQTGGNSPNTIPDLCVAYPAENYPAAHCRATIDVRTNLSSERNDALWNDLQAILTRQPKIAFRIRDRGKAYLSTSAEFSLISLCQQSITPVPEPRIAQGGSDAGYYALLTPHIVGGFGPGEDSQLHTDTESIEIATLRTAPGVFSNLVRTFIGL